MNLPINIISTEFDGTFFAESENSPVPGDLQRLIGQLQEAGARLVERILTAKQREIDNLVCALHGQSMEEIKLVEGGAKWKSRRDNRE